MATGQSEREGLEQAAGGVSSTTNAARKGAKAASSLAKKVKAGKAGSKVAKSAGKKAMSLLSLKIKLIILGFALGLLLIIIFVSFIPMLIGNSLMHQSDPESLSDGKDITYYGSAEEDFKVLTETELRAKEVVLDIFANGEKAALEDLKNVADLEGWVLDEAAYQPPNDQQENESMVMVYSSYSASMRNAMSEEAFEYYQGTSAIDDLEKKMRKLVKQNSTVYDYGNKIHGADFLKDANGKIITRTVCVSSASTDPETGATIPAEYVTYVTPVVHPVNVEEVADAAFFTDGVTMESPYYEEDREAAEAGMRVTTYADIITDMSLSLGSMLFGDEFWDGSDIFWGGVLGVPNDFIVNTARSQLGNRGGRIYWSWWPFSSRVEWCAIFVSWCADQCGYLEQGIIPRYASCRIGIDWFQARDQWHSRRSGYVPKAGDIIFFDWYKRKTGGRDGRADHTGIVASCVGGTVYTIEGNSGDAVKERSYPMSSLDILGYGTPNYPAEDMPQEEPVEEIKAEKPAA